MIAMRPSNTLSDQQVNDTIDLFADAAGLLGHDLLAAGSAVSFPLVDAIKLVRPIVSDLFGFPGTPKVDVDLSPNPPKDTDGRREDSGRGWVRELQGRWPGVLG